MEETWRFNLYSPDHSIEWSTTEYAIRIGCNGGRFECSIDAEFSLPEDAAATVHIAHKELLEFDASTPFGLVSGRCRINTQSGLVRTVPSLKYSLVIHATGPKVERP